MDGATEGKDEPAQFATKWHTSCGKMTPLVLQFIYAADLQDISSTTVSLCLPGTLIF